MSLSMYDASAPRFAHMLRKLDVILTRAALNRLLDETDTSLTLTTLASAAAALGRQVGFELCAV